MTIGRIYKIVSGQTNECYVGSTFNELKYRFRQHKDDYKKWKDGKHNLVMVYNLFDKYGVKNCPMILIKEYEVEDREHLKVYEQLWINKLKSINKLSAFVIEPVLKKKKKEQQKIYREKNKGKIAEQDQIYREKNKGKIAERGQKYHEENKEKINNRHRNHYSKIKETINEKRKEKMTCEICNCEFRKADKTKHERTKKHQTNLSKQQ